MEKHWTATVPFRTRGCCPSSIADGASVTLLLSCSRDDIDRQHDLMIVVNWSGSFTFPLKQKQSCIRFENTLPLLGWFRNNVMVCYRYHYMKLTIGCSELIKPSSFMLNCEIKTGSIRHETKYSWPCKYREVGKPKFVKKFFSKPACNKKRNIVNCFWNSKK